MERKQKIINSELCHDLLIKNTPPRLSNRGDVSFFGWKKQIKEQLLKSLRMDLIKKYACPINFEIEWEEDKGSYRLIRFTIESEIDVFVPCYVTIPKLGKNKYPIAITLQGHTTGFHNSIGEPRSEKDKINYPRTAIAVQAAENGYIGIAIEQRGMGERLPKKQHRFGVSPCTWTTRTGNALGRVILGERIWDVMRIIDALNNFKECDLDKILITGNSGGGTVSYYAACLDERIKLSVPSCSFCSYKDSILEVAHCGCNYIPSAYLEFEMQDLSCLIAPRNLIVVTGENDPIFPINGVKTSFKTVQEIFRESGAKDNCRLVITPKGHWWCVDLVWSEINKECKKLGWI